MCCHTEMLAHSLIEWLKLEQTASLLGAHTLEYEFDSAARLSKRLGSVGYIAFNAEKAL